MRLASAAELLTKGYVQAIIIFITLLLYLLTQHILFAILIALEIFGIVALEIKVGMSRHGIWYEIKETIIALLFALLLWFGAGFLLNTPSPLSAVASCSMLPVLERGDFVIVQGAPVSAYELNLSEKQFQQLLGPAKVRDKSFQGSIYSYCMKMNDRICFEWLEKPEQFSERRGPLTFHYSSCTLWSEEGISFFPCVTSVEYEGKNYSLNSSHDIIVYQPAQNDIFSLIGDIVHRAQFKINVGEESYYLTKGDNNQVFDIQFFDYERKMGNAPVPEERVRGKVISRIPYLGYLKLFISGYFTKPEQCDTLLIQP